MPRKGKKEEISLGSDSGLKRYDRDTVAAGISNLEAIIKRVDAGTPFSDVRETFAASLDSLVDLAGQDRDVNLLARYHAVISLLETDDKGAGEKDLLVAQVNQAIKMLQGRAGRSKPAAKGVIAGPQTAEHEKLLPTPVPVCEEVLRSFPSIGDQEIAILKEHGLLEEERLLNLDALELSRMTGLDPNTAFEVKDLLRRGLGQRARQDLARRVEEMKRIKVQLSADCDRIVAANHTLLMNNKILKDQYPVGSEQVEQEVRNFKEIQSQVVSARLETNRLSAEIHFLREEHQKLLDLVEEKHLLLDDLFRRFTGIKSSFEFVNGETGFAQDIMANVEGLLNIALKREKTLNDKIVSSEESMEKLFSEFNEIVRKGKTAFYHSL